MHAETRERIRARLREAAVGALARGAGCTREEARRRVERGTWTDDEAAAAFLAGEDEPTLGARLAGALRGAPPARRGARRAAEELARREREGWE